MTQIIQCYFQVTLAYILMSPTPIIRHTIKADSVATCPEQISVPWEERISNITWAENENVKFECVQNKQCCQAIKIENQVYQGSKGHGKRMIYVHKDSKIIFANGFWVRVSAKKKSYVKAKLVCSTLKPKFITKPSK